jgi:putative PEP-CTERM system histidine kinase
MFDLQTPAVVGASYGLATAGFALFAGRLAIGRRGGAKAASLLIAVVLGALWAALTVAFALSPSLYLWAGAALVDGLRMGAWLVFAMLVLDKLRGWRLALAIVLALVAALLVAAEPPMSTLPAPGGIARLPYGVLLAMAILGLALAEQIFRRAGPQARWAVKPLCLALGGSFVFDLYMHADALLFGRLDADLWAARGLAQAFVIPLIAMATARNKDWTIDIALSRGVVFHSTAFLASGLYLLAVASAGYYVRYFGGNWGRMFQATFIFGAMLLLGWLFSSGALRAKLKVFISKNFFSYRYDYREEWLRFTGLLSASGPELSTTQRSIQALANLVESPAGALWLRDTDGALTQAARWNTAAVAERVTAESQLPQFLTRTGWVVDLTELRQNPSKYAGLELPAWLVGAQSAWLVVPILAEAHLIGFVVLDQPRTRLEVNWEVLDLLKTAARQLGSFLAQIQASEALLEARKFEAFNKMGAFVVHDLKNLVAQLSLLLSNAERHGQNPRFQQDMLKTVQHVTERMNKMLVQLSTGSRPQEALRPVDLGKLAAHVVAGKGPRSTPINVRDDGHVLALGYEQRLERVIGHMVQNAIDATTEGGSVEVHVTGDASWSTVEVIDTGRGMSEAFVREKLFRPFQTTKPTGMGIGAFETAQYVKETGGRIEADSRLGAGTRIRIVLPRHHEQLSEARVKAAA